jgi:hypothetical protein
MTNYFLILRYIYIVFMSRALCHSALHNSIMTHWILFSLVWPTNGNLKKRKTVMAFLDRIFFVSHTNHKIRLLHSSVVHSVVMELPYSFKKIILKSKSKNDDDTAHRDDDNGDDRYISI